MNKSEIAEMRRRLNPEDNNLSRIRGCYVNEKREIVSLFDCEPLSLPQEESEKYLAAFKRTLSGVQGKNLLPIAFSPAQVLESDEHRLLTALRDTQLEDEETAREFFARAIESIDLEGNYLILLTHDAYDVPYQARDEQKVDDASEEVFHYILCSVCPVKLSKPALSYYAQENAFHAREQDWIVTAPEMGFLFPAFDDRAANIYGALYFTRDTEAGHEAFVDGVFGTEAPMAAGEQRQAFQSVLEEALADECNLEVVKTVHEQLRDMIEEQKSDKEAEPLTVSRREMRTMLESCGVPEERVAVFEEKYEETFGATSDLPAVNIVETKQFALRTPNVVIRVDPQYSELIETRVIDGVKYILVRADEGVEVNGVNISISDE